MILRRDFDRLRLQAMESAVYPLRSASDFRILVTRTKTPEDPVAQGLQEEAGTETGPWNLTCPASVLKGNLRIRNWSQGDRFQPFGLDGTRKLNDLLREKRIPADRREGTLVVEDDEGILWVVGVSRAERTRLLPSTGQTVTIQVIERTSPQ